MTPRTISPAVAAAPNGGTSSAVADVPTPPTIPAVSTVPAGTDVAFRSRFPMLEHTVYLGSCSLGARSVNLDASMTRMLEAMLEHGSTWRQFEEQVAEARERFAALIGALPEQIAVVPNASVGAYQVASTLEWSRRPGIVTTIAEFPSVAHVWLAQRPRGAEVAYVPERGGTVALDDYVKRIDNRTGLVSVPMTTYRHAARLPVRDVAVAAHAAGARVFVDAYQAVGVEPVDVRELGCDYLVAGAMKYLLGLPGVAFLYARSPAAPDRAPRLTGWFGRIDPFAFDPTTLDFPDEARRFETGTPAIPTLYAASAGLELVSGLDLHAVRRHVTSLATYAAGRLTAQGEALAGPADPAERGAHVALVDPDPLALAGWLAAHSIVVSPRGKLARISFHHYNSIGDVDAICEAIARYRSDHAGAASRPFPHAQTAVLRNGATEVAPNDLPGQSDGVPDPAQLREPETGPDRERGQERLEGSDQRPARGTALDDVAGTLPDSLPDAAEDTLADSFRDAAEDLERWLAAPVVASFPYEAVIEEYHRVGKHFVAPQVLEALDRVRSALPGIRGSASAVRRLERFLDAALDKFDGRYDYQTYLALGLLPLPWVRNPADDTAPAERQCDRLLVGLVCDALRVELAAVDGTTDFLPQMRPDPGTTSKRCRLGLKAARPALNRLSLPASAGDGESRGGRGNGGGVEDPVAAARERCRAVDACLPAAERLSLRLTMLPVYVVHDEHLFIRVLQSFETIFALIGVLLRSAACALASGEHALAERRIRHAGSMQCESAPLFSLLATMQVEAFRIFRQYTEGASAIQSRTYKTVESLCRTPEGARLHSVAYRSVPEVRDRVLAGEATLDDEFAAAVALGRLGGPERDALVRAMRQFEAAHLNWRQTHYRLAVRMLGERPGTGYTEGTPYLKSVRSIPVFRSCDDPCGASSSDPSDPSIEECAFHAYA